LNYKERIMVFNLREGINLWAILVGGVSSMVIGFIWYGPLLGKAWARYTGWTEDKIKSLSGKTMGVTYGLTFIAALASCLALMVFSRSLGAVSVADGLLIGLLAGVGFAAMAFATTHLFDHKPVGLWLIVSGYQIVFLAVAGIIVTVWR
jgi:hypothetical protein